MRKPANRVWSQTKATGAIKATGASAALEPLSTGDASDSIGVAQVSIGGGSGPTGAGSDSTGAVLVFTGAAPGSTGAAMGFAGAAPGSAVADVQIGEAGLAYLMLYFCCKYAKLCHFCRETLRYNVFGPKNLEIRVQRRNFWYFYAWS